MSTRLLVSNLSKKTSEADLVNLFNRVGLVLSATLHVDDKTGAHTSSGFVFMTEAGAQEALRVLSGAMLHEQEISVRVTD
jgi:RNA recognition motif-containing protein